MAAVLSFERVMSIARIGKKIATAAFVVSRTLRESTTTRKKEVPMRKLEEDKFAIEEDGRESERPQGKSGTVGFSRRAFLEVGSAGLASAALSSLAVNAQERASTQKAEHDHSSSDPGQENRGLREMNPNSNNPPPTDHGDLVPIWYSFDLVKKRVEEGGWTHEVTQRELPSSQDIAGVNMRLTAGSYRE
jgi:hypothetical protein